MILGLGNTIMSDDGFGPRVIEFLEENCRLQKGVTLLDGGTLGLDLLPRLDGVDNLLIVDAIDVGRAPGTVIRLSGDDVPDALGACVSPHQMGVADLLAVARLQGCLPRNVVLWGAQPASVRMGLVLSPGMEAAVEAVAGEVVKEVENWGSGG